MKQLIIALCLVASFAQAQVSQRYAARIYRVGDQLVIADSVGTNQTIYPFTVAQIVATNSLVRVNISGLSKYYVPAKILNSSGVAYSTTSTTAAVAGILATVPDGTVPTSVTQIGGVKLVDYNDNKTATDQAIQLKVSYVLNVTDLATNNASSVIVRDANRGGTFTYKPGSFTVDNGISFQGSGGIYERQYTGNVQAQWYNAKGDGVTDDYDAIQNSIQGAVRQKYIAGIGQLGGNVQLGLGSFIIGNGKRIVLPDRIRLIGQGRRLTEIKINTGFKVAAGDSVVIELSNRLQVAGAKNVFHTAVENLSLNLNNAPGVIGIYSDCINEGSGAFNFLIANILYKGIQIVAVSPSPGYGSQNFAIEHGELIFGNSETATSAGIQLDLNGATVQTISDISFVGKNVTATGLDVSGASGFTVQKIHIENLATGLKFGQRSQCFAFSVSGVDAQQIVTASIFFRGTTDSYNYILTGIRSTGGGITIQDFRNQPTGRTNISGPIAIYAVGGESYASASSRTVICSNILYARQILPVYADNTAAGAANLQIGAFYRTATGELRIRY